MDNFFKTSNNDIPIIANKNLKYTSKRSKQYKRCKRMEIGTKLVRVSNKTHRDLDKLRGKGVSYDKVIRRLLTAHEAKLRINDQNED